VSRPNKARQVFAEDHLAARIAKERKAQTMSLEGLAKRMTGAGCAINQSAIYKIEQGQPRRRITVDELVGFARAFNMSVEDLLTAPELLASKRLAPLLDEWRRLIDRRREACEAIDRRIAEIDKELNLISNKSPEAAEFMRSFLADLTPEDAHFGDNQWLQYMAQKAREVDDGKHQEA
jgi:transcriptional regulator with XRE-family HTH domain